MTTRRAPKATGLSSSALLALLVTSAACTDLSLPEHAILTCGDDDDCPAPLVCRTQLGRCLDPGLLDAPVISFEAPVALSREVASRVPPHDTVEVTFALNRRPKTITLRLDDTEVGACALDRDGLTARCSFSLSEVPDAAEGVHGVTAIVEDELANRARDEAALRFDFTAPTVPPDTVWLRLRAAPTSAIREVAAVGLGGSADLQFVVSETLGPPAAVRAELDAASLAFARNDDESFGLLELHAFSVDDTVADGVYAIAVTLEDPVGNQATVTLAPALVVDATAPAAPLDDAEALVLHRAPWGVDESGGAPRFIVRAAAGVVESGALVVVTSGEDGLGVELGRGPAGADGSFDLPLIPQDLPRVFVSAVDAAGNQGPATLVRGHVWRATLGRKVAGESFANPHALYATGRLVDVLRPPGTTEVSDAALTGALGDVVSVDVAGAWRPLPLSGTTHPALMDAAVVYDRSVGRALLFGGAGPPNQAPQQLFWERAGERWRELTVEGPLPPARRDHALVWDADRRRAVLFGGRGNGIFAALDDTWVFDGERWTRIAHDVHPVARTGHAMVWDAERGVVVLFGGMSGGDALDDTWELHGDTWIEVPTATTPPARLWHAMAFDEARGDVVLFGGVTTHVQETPALDDTWVYANGAWEERPLARAPSARVDHAMVFEDQAGVVRLTGGRPTSCTPTGATCDPLDDTWAWDGAAWSDAHEPIGALSGGVGAAMHASYYDPVRARVFLVGGWHGAVDIAGEAPEARLYERTARGWTQRLAASGHFRHELGFAYDVARDRFVAHGGGGFGGAAFGYAEDVDEFDGESWGGGTSGSPPIGRQEHALAYVPGLGVLMLGMAGTDEPTWRWNGKTWGSVPSMLHPRVSREAFAWDAAREELVLFGGLDGNGPSSATWTFTAAEGWAEETPTTSPPARTNHAMAFDEARGRVVVFGGTDAGGAPLDDTWEWDGQAWHDVSPDEGPPGREGAELAYDPVGRRVLLFGGVSSGALHDDTWAFDGTSWWPVEAPLLPAARRDFGMAWDPVERRLFVTSGRDGSQVTASDAWTLEPGHEARAAVIAEVVLDASGAPVDVTPTRVRVRAVAGASHTVVDESGAASEVPGVELRAFSGGRWRTLASAAYGRNAPGAVEATETAVSSWLGGEGRRMSLAVTMSEPGGVVTATGVAPGVTVDYLEVEVAYTTPAP